MKKAASWQEPPLVQTTWHPQDPPRGETRRMNTVHSRLLHPALWPRAGLPTSQVQTQPESPGPRGRDPD